ncbi:MAG: ATP-binding protein [Candidatus Omnitrophica bacterium]|nr:ATP-binding protein [Candidatus Omnitrophota bacterium]MDD5237582.1 ATP-binding protein [Candidatus Omnitrophota bacterium]
MNFLTISSILVVIAAVFLSIFIILTSKKSSIGILWAFFCITPALWGIGTCINSVLPKSEYDIALFWWQFAYTGTIMAPVIFTHFIYKFLNLKKKMSFHLSCLYLLGGIFLFFNWYNNSRFFLGNLRFVFNQFYWVDWIKYKNPVWIIFYIGFYWLLLGYSFLLLIKAYKTITDNIRRNQIKYFILGSIFGWLGTESMFLIPFHIDIYPFFNLSLAFYTIIFAYAIIKYRLMDIKIAITRASLFIAVYTLVLGLPFAVTIWFKSWLMETFGPGWWGAPLGLMAALATVGPFLYIYIQRKAEDKLLKEQRQYQNTLKQASIGMTRIRNLRKLLDLITHIVTKSVKISYAAIYLYNSQTNDYELQVSRDKDRIPIQKIAFDNPLLTWIMVKREPLIYEEIKRQMEDTGDVTSKLLEENMRILTASVIIPSFLEDRFLGFFVLGDKMSGQIYSPEDLNVFQVLASQAALAIENAQFYEDTKEMQAQIAQAEKMATVGTMADGLSHQINNRFYALALITGDSINTVKSTDTSKCTPEVKEMINSLSYALERIQANVLQGGEVVKGILKYTRKGEEGFTELTIDQVLDGTLEMVQYKVKLSEIDIVRDYPKNIPKIYGNLPQLQEVFFNLIDNAYDSIVEKRNLLKEEGYRGKITFTAYPWENKLRIVSEDNGLGIKADQVKKIFTPFFTTKTSTRKGTGLGLYVIRRIITDTHKGQIAFETEYQAGTKFIIDLPVTK